MATCVLSGVTLLTFPQSQAHCSGWHGWKGPGLVLRGHNYRRQACSPWWPCSFLGSISIISDHYLNTSYASLCLLSQPEIQQQVPAQSPLKTIHVFFLAFPWYSVPLWMVVDLYPSRIVKLGGLGPCRVKPPVPPTRSPLYGRQTLSVNLHSCRLSWYTM